MLKKSFWVIIFLFVFQIVCFGQSESVINVGIVNKKAISLAKPQVPNQHLHGIVEQIVAVQVVIDESGKVISANAIFGHALLRGVCENASRQAKFPPTYITSKPFKINALLVYKFKTDRTIDINIEKDDESLIGKAVKFVDPPANSCDCKFAGSVSVIVETDEQGNVVKASAISGHQVLRYSSEQVALKSKFLPINQKTRFIISYNFAETDKWSARFKYAEIKKGEFLEQP